MKQVFLIMSDAINFINQKTGIVRYIRDKIDPLRDKVGTGRKEELTSTRLKSKAFIDRGHKNNNNRKLKGKGN